jgi:hypothetical protein
MHHPKPPDFVNDTTERGARAVVGALRLCRCPRHHTDYRDCDLGVSHHDRFLVAGSDAERRLGVYREGRRIYCLRRVCCGRPGGATIIGSYRSLPDALAGYRRHAEREPVVKYEALKKLLKNEQIARFMWNELWDGEVTAKDLAYLAADRFDLPDSPLPNWLYDLARSTRREWLDAYRGPFRLSDQHIPKGEL